ncbi:GGDEF domain-containing protein [Bacillus sp. 1P06AnD]|uniref:GGDEF domain-containing protein n=1 Tax=Bacillus sp. 1P06AnD TaxID=3132208 RepID=UPI0039A10F67
MKGLRSKILTDPAIMHDHDFWQFRLAKNRKFLLIVAIMVLLLESIMMAGFYFSADFKLPEIPDYYLYVYLSAIAGAILFLGVFHFSTQQIKRMKSIQYGYVLFISVWSAVFAALDVRTGLSSYIFMQIVLLNSVGVRIPSLVHWTIHFISFTIFLMLLVFIPDLPSKLFWAETVNSFYMVIIANIIVRYCNNEAYKDYRKKRMIETQNAKLNYFAYNDFLTNIPNRKSIIECMHTWLKKPGHLVCCMVVDIDNFKLYNDTYGHVEGDKCLERAAHVMKNLVGANGGRIGRYGGEEFLIVFHDKSSDEIHLLSSQIVRAIEQEKIEFLSNKNGEVVTISLGAYINTSQLQRSEEVISYADKALYYAKHSGKNTFRVYNDMPEDKRDMYS